MKCENCLHFGVCVYARMLPGEIRDDDNFKCPDFADRSRGVKEFAKFIIDKARQAKIHVMDIPDYVAEFTRGGKEHSKQINYKNKKELKTMEKFRITITDMETGETKIDEKTDCIIGAYNKNDEKVAGLSMGNCGTIDLIRVIHGAQTVIDELFKRDSKLKALSGLLELMGTHEVTERTEKFIKEDARCRNSEN